MRVTEFVRLTLISVCVLSVFCVWQYTQESLLASTVVDENPSNDVVVSDQVDTNNSHNDTESCDTENGIISDSEGVIQSLHFKEGSTVRDALRMLGLKYHKNIIPTSKVQGKLNITAIYNLTFEEALDVILGYEFKYEQDGNCIRVYTRDEYQKVRTDESRMQCKVFKIYYISPEDASRLIMPVLSPRAIVQTSSMPETGLSSGDSVDVKEGGVSDAQFATLVIKDYPENLEAVGELLKSLDERPSQVLVEATILSAALTEGMELGVDMNFLNGESVANISAIAGGLPGAAIETTGFAGTKSGHGIKIGVTSGDVSSFITALESITDTTILANPKILALNKQLGTVFIGQKEPYRSSSSVSGSGVATEGEVKFLDTGTKLSFRPYIGKDGYIRMDIYPKDSTSTDTDIDVPKESTAELSSNIMVKDGETIVIGGLFRDEMTTTKSQVPILGDLPLVGVLFRSTADTSQRQEVIILLTCHIIKDTKDTNSEQRKEDVSRKRFAALDRFQSIGVAKISEGAYRRAVACYKNGDKERALAELEDALYLRPTYLDAIRLKEKILKETHPEKFKKLDRKLSQEVENADDKKWNRF